MGLKAAEMWNEQGGSRSRHVPPGHVVPQIRGTGSQHAFTVVLIVGGGCCTCLEGGGAEQKHKISPPTWPCRVRVEG